jgi:hypothetical protein
MNKYHDKKKTPHNNTNAHPLSEKERGKILETALYRMVMIDGMVYSAAENMHALRQVYEYNETNKKGPVFTGPFLYF